MRRSWREDDSHEALHPRAISSTRACKSTSLYMVTIFSLLADRWSGNMHGVRSRRRMSEAGLSPLGGLIISSSQFLGQDTENAEGGESSASQTSSMFSTH